MESSFRKIAVIDVPKSEYRLINSGEVIYIAKALKADPVNKPRTIGVKIAVPIIVL